MKFLRSITDEHADTILSGGELVSDENTTVEKILLASATMITNPRIRAAVGAASLAYSVGRHIKTKFNAQKTRKSFTIKIYENDPLFDVVQTWIVEALSEEEQRSVVAFSLKANKSYGSLEDHTHQKQVSIAYDGSRVQTVIIDGHSVVIRLAEGQRGIAKSNGSERAQTTFANIEIECPNINARRAVLKKLRDENSKIIKRPPRFYTAQRWGDFSPTSDVPKRPIETVILKHGQAERVVGDLTKFLSQEQDYVRLGIPYRRGVLLSGPPGTGKTSLASAIAHELGLNVYYIALSALESDTTLTELLGSINPRSILLLEDVDVVHAAKERTDDERGVTMAGLLNALDGFITPHGLITIMTTNHIEVLDPALIRPGRVDLIEEVGSLDHSQLERMCQLYLGFVPDGLPVITVEDEIMPSEVVEIFKRTLDTVDNLEIGRLLVDVMEKRVLYTISVSDSLAEYELTRVV